MQHIPTMEMFVEYWNKYEVGCNITWKNMSEKFLFENEPFSFRHIGAVFALHLRTQIKLAVIFKFINRNTVETDVE